MLRAYDKVTGKEVGAVFIPAPQSGSPMTYMANGQPIHRRRGERRPLLRGVHLVCAPQRGDRIETLTEGLRPRTPPHALSRAAAPARSVRVARSRCSLAVPIPMSPEGVLVAVIALRAQARRGPSGTASTPRNRPSAARSDLRRAMCPLPRRNDDGRHRRRRRADRREVQRQLERRAARPDDRPRAAEHAAGQADVTEPRSRPWTSCPTSSARTRSRPARRNCPARRRC